MLLVGVLGALEGVLASRLCFIPLYSLTLLLVFRSHAGSVVGRILIGGGWKVLCDDTGTRCEAKSLEEPTRGTTPCSDSVCALYPYPLYNILVLVVIPSFSAVELAQHQFQHTKIIRVQQNVGLHHWATPQHCRSEGPAAHRCTYGFKIKAKYSAKTVRIRPMFDWVRYSSTTLGGRYQARSEGERTPPPSDLAAIRSPPRSDGHPNRQAAADRHPKDLHTKSYPSEPRLLQPPGLGPISHMTKSKSVSSGQQN